MASCVQRLPVSLATCANRKELKYLKVAWMSDCIRGASEDRRDAVSYIIWSDGTFHLKPNTLALDAGRTIRGVSESSHRTALVAASGELHGIWRNMDGKER